MTTTLKATPNLFDGNHRSFDGRRRTGRPRKKPGNGHRQRNWGESRGVAIHRHAQRQKAIAEARAKCSEPVVFHYNKYFSPTITLLSAFDD